MRGPVPRAVSTELRLSAHGGVCSVQVVHCEFDIHIVTVLDMHVPAARLD